MADISETKNGLWRREEQLRRWELSETNGAPSTARGEALTGSPRVRFQDGCVFLAACSSGDREEVDRLLADGRGTDIDTANVDGLTALHQACIDENMSMVKYLVEHGACINLYDNEGWTALHATASCGFANIATYLIDKGANLEAVNSEGELALDLAEGNEMEKLISEAMEKQGIDAERARNEEEETMLRDANQWLNSKTFIEAPHPKTGATALHIAAAKGYIKVLKILLDAGADVNAKDFDGWTPLHAAAHWGQEETCQILVENFCNFEAKNNAGQTALDVVDSDIEPVLEELKKKQAELIEQHKEINTKTDEHFRNISQGKRRSSITRMSVDQKASLPLKNAEEERAQMGALRQPPVEEKDEEQKALEDSDASKEESEETSETESEIEKSNEINSRTSQLLKQVNGSSQKISDLPSEVKDKKVNVEEQIVNPPPPRGTSLPPSSASSRSQNLTDAAKPDPESVLLRKRDADHDRNRATSASIPRESETKEKTVSETTKATGVVPPSVKAPISRVTSAPVAPLGSSSRAAAVTRQDPLVQKRSQVGNAEETDQKNRFNELYNRYAALVAPVNSDQRSSVRTSAAQGPAASAAAAGSSAGAGGINAASLSSQLLYGGQSSTQLGRRQAGAARKEPEAEPAAGTGSRSGSHSKNLEPAEPVASSQRRTSDVFKRDDEKEVERKARARKARETRRSTQGVSKEDLQKAEEALQAANVQRIVAKVVPEKSTASKPDDKLPSAALSSSAAILPAAGIRSAFAERRTDESPASYRKSFQDLDSTSSTIQPGYSQKSSRNSLFLPSSGSVTTSSAIAAVAPSVSVTSPAAPQSSPTVVPPHRIQYRSKYLQDKEEEEAKLAAEEDAKKAAATETAEDKKEVKEDPSQKSAAIRARKKRDSRRSTGRISLDGIQGSENQDDNKERQDEKQGPSSSESSSKSNPAPTGPASGIQPVSSSTNTYTRYPYKTTATKDTDFKKMYDDECALNEKLKKDIKGLQQDLTDSRVELERVKSIAVTGSSRPIETATTERRMTFTEKRTLERKISELEEELRNAETAKSESKADNQRLKDENGALIRVISKLSK